MKHALTCSDRNPPFDSFQLYLVSPDGGEHRFLTQGRGTNTSGRFSPDGKQIVYTHQEGQQFSIRMLTLADRKEALVVEQDGPKAVVSACWSPDGKYLAVSRFDYHVLEPHGVLISPPHLDANYRLEIISLDGKERREIKLEGAEVKSMSLNDWR